MIMSSSSYPLPSKQVSYSASSLKPVADVSDFFQLLKPRVMSLVVFTALIGMLLSRGTLEPVLAFISLFAIATGAGASGALNMWFDSDIDALMERTKTRPLPSGRMVPSTALAFGIILSIVSVVTLAFAANWLAACLLAFTIFFYIVIYSMCLKRFTVQNIVIGGAAGALPPVVGWAAMTGEVSTASLTLFLIIFVWTPPHFWALSLVKNDDYRAANVPMMPVVKGNSYTIKQIIFYSFLLLPVALFPFYIGLTGYLYAIFSGLFSVYFIYLSLRLYACETGSKDEHKKAMSLFFTSIVYLFSLFSMMVIDSFYF